MNRAAEKASTKGMRDLDISSGQARWIIIVCTLLFMINCMDRQVLSAVLEPMKNDLGKLVPVNPDF